MRGHRRDDDIGQKRTPLSARVLLDQSLRSVANMAVPTIAQIAVRA